MGLGNKIINVLKKMQKWYSSDDTNNRPSRETIQKQMHDHNEYTAKQIENERVKSFKEEQKQRKKPHQSRYEELFDENGNIKGQTRDHGIRIKRNTTRRRVNLEDMQLTKQISTVSLAELATKYPDAAQKYQDKNGKTLSHQKLCTINKRPAIYDYMTVRFGNDNNRYEEFDQALNEIERYRNAKYPGVKLEYFNEIANELKEKWNEEKKLQNRVDKNTLNSMKTKGQKTEYIKKYHPSDEEIFEKVMNSLKTSQKSGHTQRYLSSKNDNRPLRK